MRIENHRFFEGQSAETIARLIGEAHILRLEPGEIVFEEDSESELLYLVLEGTVAFSKRIEGDVFHPVSTALAGEFFGEIGVVTGERRSLRAEAGTPLVLAALNKVQIEDFVTETTGPLALTLRSVIQHLHHTTRHLMEDVLHREKMAVVGSMVNSIIHDFKNPVAYIRFAAEYLGRKHDDPSTRELCGKIDQQVERMLNMAEEVSLYSRGEHRPMFAPVRLPELMERFRELNFTGVNPDGVTLSFDIEDLVIQAEAGKLIRVLQNLVGNAIDARPDSGKIDITARSEGDRLRLAIQDNAGGIPEAIRDTFFEPFVTHGKQRGTGLGSAIAKSIVEAHGGTITFATTTGEGTIFEILLPLTQPDLDDNPPGAAP